MVLLLEHLTFFEENTLSFSIRDILIYKLDFFSTYTPWDEPDDAFDYGHEKVFFTSRKHLKMMTLTRFSFFKYLSAILNLFRLET